MNRHAEINQIILVVLDKADGHALPESTLKEHMYIRLRPRATDEETAQSLAWLKEQGLVKSLPGQFGSDEPRWLITESGQVRLAQ